MIKVIKNKSIKLKSEESLFIDIGGYDVNVIAQIKTLEKRIYLPDSRLWEIPLYLIKDIIRVLDGYKVNIAEDIDIERVKTEQSENQSLTFEVGNVAMFQEEINLIQDKDIREWTLKALEYLPDYFFHIPASSTGKYHPEYCLGEGGLARHCKAASKIAKDLFPFSTLFNFNQQEQDEIIASLLLHDGAKNGLGSSNFTVHEHPLAVCEHLETNEELNKLLSKEIRDNIFNNIRSHMSQWNTNKRSKIILPLPENNSQKFVALCDYLASRKDINIIL